MLCDVRITNTVRIDLRMQTTRNTRATIDAQLKRKL